MVNSVLKLFFFLQENWKNCICHINHDLESSSVSLLSLNQQADETASLIGLKLLLPHGFGTECGLPWDFVVAN